MSLCGNVCRVRSLPGVKRSIGWTEECVGVRCAFGLRVRTLQRSATPSNIVQRVAAQYDTSQCRYIDQLGVGPIRPLLHEIDAVGSCLRLVDAVHSSTPSRSCSGSTSLFWCNATHQ
jgi:hypothetical protein